MTALMTAFLAGVEGKPIPVGLHLSSKAAAAYRRGQQERQKTLKAGESELDRLKAENERLREACQLALGVISGLADQQAMKDEWWIPHRDMIRAALAPGEQT